MMSRYMFAATAVIASALFLARVPQVAWEVRTTAYWQATGAILIGLCSTSLLVVLPGCLAGLAPGSILFVDEIHRLSIQVEEVLYSAMEDFALDLVVGSGPAARTMRIAIEPMT